MTLDEQIKAALTDAVGAAALIAIVAARVYVLEAPQSNTIFPVVVWNELTIEPAPTLETLGTDAGFVVIQFHCWADTTAAAKAVRAALGLALAAYTFEDGVPSAQNGPGAYLEEISRKCNAPLNVRFFSKPL